ncbi:TetR/AcrR family transcriptional regulator [Qipengyuania sp. 6D47A]|uniref:TetR/AcrR family transcriptional regulator n=1 Tax=Qipengyuania qiaonensis TaxID=2867240 RepID=A0ABS7J8E6_9SPHN|nr:TetR/AcrR family transcriptional regulator [Qipengyuania qiaonensis]MBX7483590.1 TetR/AcrR family transcriptional regulator [Qipengyuania qiaonensis]
MAQANRLRIDARRSEEAVIDAARALFAAEGVDVPNRSIANAAGVGIGTLYRRFPTRADLIAAVFRQEIDACAAATEDLAATHSPFEALAEWLRRFAAFIATKRGFSAALHSGDPAYAGLPRHFEDRFYPALDGLLKTAREAGVIRDGLTADDLVKTVARLVSPQDTGLGERMLEVLIDGLRAD